MTNPRLLLLLAALAAFEAAHAKPLTLDEARAMALDRNHFLKAAHLKTEELDAKIQRSRAEYYPTVTLQAEYAHFWEVPVITASAGAFGSIPLNGQMVPMPPGDREVTRGKHDLVSAGVLAYQPITQLGKISTGVDASRVEKGLAEIQAEAARRKILLGVASAWFGLRAAAWDGKRADARVAKARQSLQDAESAVGAGKLIETGRAGLAAALADEQRKLLEAEADSENLQAELRALLGIDSAQAIAVDDSPLAELPDPPPLDECLKAALLSHDDLRQARLQQEQARLALRAARQSYLPSLGIVGGLTWQNSATAYLPEYDPFVGVLARWNLHDLHANRYESAEKEILGREAAENRLGKEQQVRADVGKAWRKLKNAKAQWEAARKARDYRIEDKQDHRRGWNAKPNGPSRNTISPARRHWSISRRRSSTICWVTLRKVFRPASRRYPVLARAPGDGPTYQLSWPSCRPSSPSCSWPGLSWSLFSYCVLWTYGLQ